MSTPSSNPGCLSALINLFGKKKERSTDNVENVRENVAVDAFPYRLRDDFLSPAEQSFFQVLKNMVSEYFVICSKVSLGDIFFVVKPNENKSAYNRINRKHVDFLICDPKTMKPRLAIELDDSSHQRADREERDDFVDGVFNAANLPLIHIPVQNSYNTHELGALFKQVLQRDTSRVKDPIKPEGKTDLSGPAHSLTAQPTPVCPKCGIPMVLRTAKSGARAGQHFYGCPNYPKCREALSL